MARILHFMRTEPAPQDNEYIVITDDDDVDPEDFGTTGFHLDGTYELDDTGSLPTERLLWSK